MRVHSIEAIAVDIPLTRNFGGSTYAVLQRSTVITRMRTERARSTTATTASTVARSRG